MDKLKFCFYDDTHQSDYNLSFWRREHVCQTSRQSIGLLLRHFSRSHWRKYHWYNLECTGPTTFQGPLKNGGYCLSFIIGHTDRVAQSSNQLYNGDVKDYLNMNVMTALFHPVFCVSVHGHTKHRVLVFEARGPRKKIHTEASQSYVTLQIQNANFNLLVALKAESEDHQSL